MNQLYFDRSSVRGISENLHYRVEGYQARIDEIVALFGGDSGEDEDSGNFARDSSKQLLGSVPLDYHGRELGADLEEHKGLWIPWLNGGLVRSLKDMATALAVADEDITGADHDSADALADEFGDYGMFTLSDSQIGSR